MPLPRRMVIEVIDDKMAEVFRKMTPTQRLLSVNSMWRYARAQMLAVVRDLHPDWSEAEVRREASRRMLGTA